jgi:hypothetical protein
VWLRSMTCRIAFNSTSSLNGFIKNSTARLHGLNSHWYVAVTRDEDDGHVNPIGSDALLQIEIIETRKTDVQHKAIRDKDWWARQQLLCGCEYLRLPARASDQRFQRFAYRDFVVNNEHDWSGAATWW